jgi:endonuclease YncB( thermonuclease family)
MIPAVPTSRRAACVVALACSLLVQAPAELASAAQGAGRQTARPSDRRGRLAPQPRPHGTRIAVDPARLLVNDGDTVTIRWTRSDVETVRMLGIDAPETGDPDHDIPHPQPFGAEARTFAQGAFAASRRVELLRAATLDAYGRTLGYLFLDGRNFSVLIVEARLAEESISRYGDNGFPFEAAAVAEAAKKAGPLAFESPGAFRARMRRLAEWMRKQP